MTSDSSNSPIPPKKLSIAFVSQYFFPEQFGTNSMAADLVDRQHRVTVITGVPNYGRTSFFPGYSNAENRFENWRGVSVHRAWTVPRGRRVWQLVVNYLVFPIAGVLTAFRKIKERPDVVFCYLLSPISSAIPAIFLSRYFKSPLVYYVQDIWPESATYTLKLKHPLLVRPLYALSGWIMRKADLVLVQSEAFPPMIERFGVSAERIRVLPNTAPPMYRPLDRKQALASRILPESDQFTIMFAGNIGESQNFDAILSAAEALRERADLRWVVLGSGRDLERVKNRVEKLGLGNQFLLLGRHPEEDMPGFFAQSDVLLVSLKENDIFNLTVPYKVTCYMACGRPILAALAGEGARVVAASGGGFAVAPGDVEQLKAAVLSMMAMSAEARTKMGQAARAYYDTYYQRDLIYGQLEAWLEETARKPTEA